jgi:hypothetical protein
MPGPLLHQGATVICAHGGQAQPVTPNPRVQLGGQPVVTLNTQYVVAGCAFVPPPPGPCVTAQWVTAATKITVGGAPALLQDSNSVCTPTGTPLTPVVTQQRVKGV